MANPNTHRLCLDTVRDAWTQCSECYTYVHSDFVAYDDETGDYIYEDHTCIFTISTNCDSNFVDRFSQDCERYAKITQCDRGRKWFLDRGIMTDEGYMTALNCPQCGCDENGPIRPDDFEALPEWVDPLDELFGF